MIPVVTIDGPSGCGKGTVSQLLAADLNWHWLDSGVMYRLLACYAKQQRIALDDADGLEVLAKDLPYRMDSQSLPPSFYLAEEDVTHRIRRQACGQQASMISTFPAIRDALTTKMRACLQPPGLITDGRDMGTVVFPDALLKIYLDASPAVRAERRYRQLQEKNINVTLADVLADTVSRDQRDRERSVAPLEPAADAVLVDTSEMRADEVFHQLRELIQNRLGQLND